MTSSKCPDRRRLIALFTKNACFSQKFEIFTNSRGQIDGSDDEKSDNKENENDSSSSTEELSNSQLFNKSANSNSDYSLLGNSQPNFFKNNAATKNGSIPEHLKQSTPMNESSTARTSRQHKETPNNNIINHNKNHSKDEERRKFMETWSPNFSFGSSTNSDDEDESTLAEITTPVLTRRRARQPSTTAGDADSSSRSTQKTKNIEFVNESIKDLKLNLQSKSKNLNVNVSDRKRKRSGTVSPQMVKNTSRKSIKLSEDVPHDEDLSELEFSDSALAVFEEEKREILLTQDAQKGPVNGEGLVAKEMANDKNLNKSPNCSIHDSDFEGVDFGDDE